MQDARRDASAGCWLCSPADRAQHVHLQEGCCPIALRCASQLRHTSQQCKTRFFKSSNSRFLQGRHIKQCRAALRHGPWCGPCRWRRCQMMRTRACFPAGTRAAAAAAVVPSWQAWLLVGLCQMTRVAKASSMRTRESQPDGMMSSGAMPTSACSQSSGTKVHMSAGSGQSMPPLALQDAPLKG